MPQMSSLVDARGAFLELPQRFLRRPHWLRAGKALLTASQTGRLIDIQWAFDTLVAAVDEEGWFDLGGDSAMPWAGAMCGLIVLCWLSRPIGGCGIADALTENRIS